MDNVAISTRTQLAARELLALDNAEGVRIECVSGELWITTEGGAGDLIVVAGESIELQGISRAYISGAASGSLRHHAEPDALGGPHACGTLCGEAVRHLPTLAARPGGGNAGGVAALADHRDPALRASGRQRRICLPNAQRPPSCASGCHRDLPAEP